MGNESNPDPTTKLIFWTSCLAIRDVDHVGQLLSVKSASVGRFTALREAFRTLDSVHPHNQKEAVGVFCSPALDEHPYLFWAWICSVIDYVGRSNPTARFSHVWELGCDVMRLYSSWWMTQLSFWFVPSLSVRVGINVDFRFDSRDWMCSVVLTSRVCQDPIIPTVYLCSKYSPTV